MVQQFADSRTKLKAWFCPQVFQALFQFDSRATALLFKDLSKAGVGQRAVELFDWLRKLEEGHALRPLCDVYTYTAMIAQCIYQQVLLTFSLANLSWHGGKYRRRDSCMQDNTVCKPGGGAPFDL